MNKGLLGKVSIFSLISVAFVLMMILVLPSFSVSFISNLTQSSLNASTLNQLLNFTINNINTTGNITQVNITLPAGFNLISGSDTTTATGTSFSNTSNVVLWTNTSATGFIYNGTTNYFSFNVSVPSVANTSYNFNVSTLDTAGSYNSTNVIVTVNDITSPIWSSPSNSTPSSYSPTTPSEFNITFTDNVAISKVLIELIDSGTPTNYTMTNSYGGNIYNYTRVLSANDGNPQYWKVYANDTSGNWNFSNEWDFTMQKADNPVSLYLNGTQNGNKTYTYPEVVNATAASLTGNVYLFRDGANVSTPEEVLLGAGSHAYSVNATGNVNYSDNTTFITFYANVGQGTLALSMSGSNKTYPSSVLINGTRGSNSVDVDVNYTLWRNSTLVTSGFNTSGNLSDTSQLGAGWYVYTYNATGGTNWSSNSTGVVLNINVSQNSSNPVNLTIDNGTAYNNQNVTITYGTSITANCSNVYSNSGSCFLYRNNTLIGNNETITLDAGVYNYTVNTSGNTNYSVNATGETFNVTVNKRILSLNITGSNVTYPNQISISGIRGSNSVDSDVNYTLWRNNTLVSSGNGTSGNLSDTSQLGAGWYVYTYNATGGTNWAANSSGVTLDIQTSQNSSNPVSLTISNGTANDNQNVITTYGVLTVNCSNYYSGSGSCKLYRNNTLVTNNTNETITLGVGAYNYTVNTSGNTNYSANATGETFNVTVARGTPILTLLLGGAPFDQSLTYGTTSIATANESNDGDTDVSYALYRNGALVSGTTDSEVLPEGTYVYVYNSTGGGNWSSGNVSKTLTVTAAGFVASTGGGGGGTAPVVIQVIEAQGNANLTVPTIAAGNSVNVTIAKYQDVDFRQVNISAENSVSNIKIDIVKLPGEPAVVTHTIKGTVYHYIQVNNANFADSDLKEVYIKFAVNKTWFTINGIDKTNISLYRWVSDKWVELTTTLVGNDSYEVFYQAESPGFSYFLIGTKSGEITVTPQAPASCTESWTCTDWSACANGQQTKTCTDSNNCGTTANKPAESQSCTVQAEVQTPTDNSWMYYSIAAIIIIAVAAVLFIFRSKVVTVFSKDYHYKK